jgi:hypothetical protein
MVLMALTQWCKWRYTSVTIDDVPGKISPALVDELGEGVNGRFKQRREV